MILKKEFPLWVLVTTVMVTMALWFGGSAAFAIWEAHSTVNSSNQRWCTALDLLVSKKPQSNATASLRYYYVFKNLHDEFGCE